MTEVSDLKPGDRVRVTFEGVVEKLGGSTYVRTSSSTSFFLRTPWESLEVLAPAEPLGLGAVVEVCDGLGDPLRYIRISDGEPDAYAWTVVRRGASRQALRQAIRRRWSDLRPSRVISTGVTE